MDVCLENAYQIINGRPVVLSHACVGADDIRRAIVNTNITIRNIITATEGLSFNLFDAVDFRNLSGVIGELFANELTQICRLFCRNPHFHGYPDIIQSATCEMREYIKNADMQAFLNYKYGGVEVKNTFGTKKQKAVLFKGDRRISKINKKLDWKAHHRQTNCLLGIVSDFVGGTPTIVAACYSDQLTEEDWNVKQEPRPGSAMTSFVAIGTSGYMKMKAGLMVCLKDGEYLRFFDKEA